MYIDPQLVDYIVKEFGDRINVEKVVENTGPWYTLDGIKAEWEDFNLTLEEVLSDSFYIVEDNKMGFSPIDQMIESIHEFFVEYFS